MPLPTYFAAPDGVMQFLEQTGLAQVLRTRKITNLVDYVFGVETGLDTNARKNRGGHAMERTVAGMLARSGVAFRSEVVSQEWPAITQALGSDKKRFDFVVEAHGTTYLMEVNFYTGGGSKLNEVARAYSELAPKINAVQGFEFVWITDGIGWRQAKNKLQEAYRVIPRVYNLTGLAGFIAEINRV